MWSWIALPLYFAPVFYVIFVFRRRARALAAEEAGGLTPGIKGWLGGLEFLLVLSVILSLLAAVISLTTPTTPLARIYPPVMALEAAMALLGAGLGLNALLALRRHQRRFRRAMLALVVFDVAASQAFPLLAWGVVRGSGTATPSLASILAMGEVVEGLPAALFLLALEVALLVYVWRSRRVAITCVK